MLTKTVRLYKRRVPNGEFKYLDDKHTEKVQRETWWLFGLIPVYSRETILASNL